MEELYWKQFTETGDVTDYLGYKMEVYGHGGGSENRSNVEESKSGRYDRDIYCSKQELQR